MRSYEVLREASEKIGVKAVAAGLRVSPALVYKWCEPPSAEDADASGTRNPLDRVRDIMELTGPQPVIDWLCREAGGFFVPNPESDHADRETDLLLQTQKLVTSFSKLLSEVTGSVSDDGAVDAGEAKRIRSIWERLKSTAEEFATACERGIYHPPKPLQTRPASGR